MTNDEFDAIQHNDLIRWNVPFGNGTTPWIGEIARKTHCRIVIFWPNNNFPKLTIFRDDLFLAGDFHPIGAIRSQT